MAALSHSPPQHRTNPSAQGHRVRMLRVPTEKRCGSPICIPAVTTESPSSTVWLGWGFGFLIFSYRNSSLQSIKPLSIPVSLLTHKRDVTKDRLTFSHLLCTRYDAEIFVVLAHFIFIDDDMRGPIANNPIL